MSDPFDLNQYAVGVARQPDRPAGPLSGGGSDDLVVSSPPVQWLLAAVVAALLGAAGAAFVVHSGWATLAPWFLAGPVAILLIGAFSVGDTRRRALPVYAAAAWVGPFYVATVALTLIAVAVSALNIAFWAGRL